MADLIRRHCLTVEFIGDLEEKVSDIFIKIPQFLKRADGIANSDAVGRQFGSADVYDGSAISRTPARFKARQGLRVKIMIGGKVKV